MKSGSRFVSFTCSGRQHRALAASIRASRRLFDSSGGFRVDSFLPKCGTPDAAWFSAPGLRLQCANPHWIRGHFLQPDIAIEEYDRAESARMRCRVFSSAGCTILGCIQCRTSGSAFRPCELSARPGNSFGMSFAATRPYRRIVKSELRES